VVTSEKPIRLVDAIVIAITFGVFSVWCFYTEKVFLLLLPFAIFVLILPLIKSAWALPSTLILFPLSIELTWSGSTMAISVPSELLLLTSSFVTLVVIVLNFTKFKQQIIYAFSIHTFLLLSFLVVSVLSINPVVSIKATIRQAWFLIPLVVGPVLFLKKITYKELVQWLLLPTLAVTGYTLVNHGLHGFTNEYASESFKPLFIEHGSYAAYLTMTFCVFFTFLGTTNDDGSQRNPVLVPSLVIIFIGIVFSLTRAAWVSLFGVLVLWLIFQGRKSLNFRVIVLGILVVCTIFLFASYTGLLDNIRKQFVTIGDLESNYSNLERLNRWMAAVNMFVESPFYGIGPGNYAFAYYTYRDASLTTPYSYMFANPHSEYLRILAEGGLILLFGWMSYFVLIYKKVAIAYKGSISNDSQRIISGLALAIISYLIHGVFNAYLETDKVAVPFWGIVGLLLTHAFAVSTGEKKSTVSSPLH
jgi:O-antigen ligase